MKSLVASAGVAATLPPAWVKPIVHTVILPAHAQMTVQEVCSCSFEGASVNAGTNSFSATYFWDGCPNADIAQMTITGPGVDDESGLGYLSSQNPRVFTDTVPFTNTQFQSNETYTFTLVVFDSDDNELTTCSTSAVAV